MAWASRFEGAVVIGPNHVDVRLVSKAIDLKKLSRVLPIPGGPISGVAA